MIVLVTNYTFDASAQQVTFTDINPIFLEAVIMLTNVTDGIVIYQFNDPSKGGTVAGNVLTLEYDTTLMDDADDIQIYYDDSAQLVSVAWGAITGTLGAQTDLGTTLDGMKGIMFAL